MAAAAQARRSADISRPIEKGIEMKSRIVAASVMILAATAGFAQTTNYPKAKVSFDDFKGLVAEVETHRASRLINLNTFLMMSKNEGVIPTSICMDTVIGTFTSCTNLSM
jgi:hypothetical protein